MKYGYNKSYDFLTINHFIIYFILGYLYNNHYLFAFIVGIVWELFEYCITSSKRTRKLLKKILLRS